jgi:hypothetical protein
VYYCCYWCCYYAATGATTDGAAADDKVDDADALLQIGVSTQGEPECLPLAARQSLPPGLITAHSLHNILKGSAAAGVKAPGVEGMAKVRVLGLNGALRIMGGGAQDCLG